MVKWRIIYKMAVVTFTVQRTSTPVNTSAVIYKAALQLRAELIRRKFRIGNGKFRPPNLENRSTDFDEI